MKAASSSTITLLLSFLFLTGQTGAHPLDRTFFEGLRLSLEGLLGDESAQALLYFIREKVPQLEVTMKAASSSTITLLLSFLFLTGQAGAHPLDRTFFEGPRLSLEGLLGDESAQALLYFIREKVPQLEVGDPHVQLRLSKGFVSAEQKTSPQDWAPVLSFLQTVFQESRPEESARTILQVFSDRLKREDPPISIDLTYHILRHMIDIAKTQNQKHQAEQNRIIFDSVGK